MESEDHCVVSNFFDDCEANIPKAQQTKHYTKFLQSSSIHIEEQSYHTIPNLRQSVLKIDNEQESSLTAEIMSHQAVKKRKAEGCRCTKNQCKNNYCGCHKDGKKCSELCVCQDCGNHRFIKYLKTVVQDYWMYSDKWNQV